MTCPRLKPRVVGSHDTRQNVGIQVYHAGCVSASMSPGSYTVVPKEFCCDPFGPATWQDQDGL